MTVEPSVKRRLWNADLRKRAADRQRRCLDSSNDLELLGCEISHAISSPSAITLFLSKRFSSVASASASLSWRASARKVFTSSEVASRAVSPARRRLPASRNSFDLFRALLRPAVIHALRNTFFAAELGDAGLAAQPFQDNTNLIFG